MADRSYDAYVCTFFSRFSDGGWNWQCILCALSVKYADVKEYLPTYLMGASGLLSSVGEAWDYRTALVVTVGLTVVQLVAAVMVFNRKDV